jgi:hypothetical protein
MKAPEEAKEAMLRVPFLLDTGVRLRFASPEFDSRLNA